jgi:hypothetical protein
MHSLKQYLATDDSKIRNEANLLIRKLIDNVHYAHVEKKGDEVVFNVGQGAQDKKYSNLQLRFSNSFTHPNDIYKNGDDRYFILINLKNPVEENSTFVKNTLMNENNNILKNMLYKFIKNRYYTDDQNDGKKSAELNDEIDAFYEKVKDYINSTLKNEYSSSTDYVKKHFKNTDEDLGFDSVARGSIKHLKNSIFGKDEKSFINKVEKHFGQEFKLLNKENKEIITNRLKDFYNNHLD